MPVSAACTNPAGDAGDSFYNIDHKVAQFCNGTAWRKLHSPGSGSGGCTNPAGEEGSVAYNGDNRVLQTCAGNVWRAMGPPGGTQPQWQQMVSRGANNPTPNATDFFGYSVAVSGTIAVVGAYQDESDGGTGVGSAGRAYVYDTTTGNLISTLNNPSPNASDYFGLTVSVSGTVAVVGAPYDESDGGTGVNDAGRAYVFDTATGNLIATLNNPSPHDSDTFGYSVAVSGTVAVVGAQQDESDGGTGVASAGRAYVFDTTTGNLIATLNNPSPNVSDSFGVSVAISGTTAVVGAYFDESDGGAGVSEAGRAYVFDTSTGNLTATLNHPAPNAGDYFGASVAVSGTVAVVSSIADHSAGSSGVAAAGRAYVFNTTTGTLITALNNPTPHANDAFGDSVATNGTVAVIGAYADESDGVAGLSNAGRAYVYDTTNGALIATLNNPTAAANDWFGKSVAISDSVVFVGAQYDHSAGSSGVAQAGRAYIFEPVVAPTTTAANNPSPNGYDNFGNSVAVSGNVAVVGASSDESDGGAGVNGAGRAYVFNANTGALVATLNNPSPNVSDVFGHSVAVSGTVAVVGAYQDESDGGTGVDAAGRAYVFDTTTGNLISTLNNPNPNASDLFGESVAVSGTVAVVGADYDESDGGTGVSDAGRAYVFDTTTGNLIATLNNPSPHATDSFGYSVAISGTVAVVGAYRDESDGGTGVSEAGRAYVFDTTTGNLIATLNNPSPHASDSFGYSVAVSGTVAVVGAPTDESDGGTGVSEAGRAYVFDTTTGNLIATLNNPSPNTNEWFGNTVAVSGMVAVVGAYQDESNGATGVNNAGRAYVFDTTTGNLIAILNNPSPNANDFFGKAVAISGAVVAVGAWSDEFDGGTGVTDAGRAYVFNPRALGSCVTPPGSPGWIANNSVAGTLDYCDGANWIGMGR